MSEIPLIALTGGPCGGKTTLIDELSCDPAWAGRLNALPEAISLIDGSIFSPREQSFQREMVRLQIAQEDARLADLKGTDLSCILLCHRGSLDPLAYWLDRGWLEEEFFAYTATTRTQHYRRYAAVIHLVTAADGAEQAYRRWPESHRPETAADAIRLDQLLMQVWGGHPYYHRIDNTGKDWPAKFNLAQKILKQYLP